MIWGYLSLAIYSGYYIFRRTAVRGNLSLTHTSLTIRWRGDFVVVVIFVVVIVIVVGVVVAVIVGG